MFLRAAVLHVPPARLHRSAMPIEPADHVAPFAGHSTGPASPTAAAVPVFDAFAAHKPAASPGAISLTATAGAAPAGSPPALPAYLFAEPTPPGYTAASSWGSHVSGAGAAAPPTASPTALKGATLAKAPSHPEDALFADFSPFK